MQKINTETLKAQLEEAIKDAKKIRYPYAVGAQLFGDKWQIVATGHRAFMMDAQNEFGKFGNDATPEQDEAREAAIRANFAEWLKAQLISTATLSQLQTAATHAQHSARLARRNGTLQDGRQKV